MPVFRAGEVLRSRALLAAAIALACFFAWPAMAAAESFTVNTAADEVDLTPGNEFCETAAGKCSLRAGIEESNALAGSDQISFEEELFNGSSDGIIELGSGLPPITSSLELRGPRCENESGFSGPCVEIDGVSAAPGLAIEGAEEVEVESLAITGAEVGLAVNGASKLRLRRSWFGVGIDGGAAGNGVGVELGPGADGSRIGFEEPGSGNLIVNSAGAGLDILGASNVRVLSNQFGVSPDGTAASNGTDLAIASTLGSAASDNTIGTRLGSAALATPECDIGCNLISGSASSGIDLAGDGNERLPAVGTVITGNQIGLDADRKTAIPNAGAGILVGTAPRTLIGGSRTGDANSFAGGTLAVDAGSAPYLVVRGNLIGSSAGPGGAADPPANGIAVDSSGLSFEFEEAQILDNEIGLDGGIGILQTGRGAEIARNLIEGVATGIEARGDESLIESNVIEATSLGIFIGGGFNTIVGNDIRGGQKAGIRIQGGGPFVVSGNVIGGDTAAAENTIDGSGGAAIEIANTEISVNDVARNHGAGNAGLFIDLVTIGDDEEGPNKGILPPTLDTATQTGISGFAKANAVVRVFRKQTSSAGELESFLGQAVADGNGDWSLSFPAALPVGTFVAATQTNSFGGTSELAITDVAGFATGAGQDFGSSPAASQGDKRPPHTEILQQSKVSREGDVRFFFASNERGSRYQCSLDSDKFRGCKSPKRYRGLKPGKHVFRVRAIDRAGNIDPTPAKRRFKVLG